jgi:hypothetical protein
MNLKLLRMGLVACVALSCGVAFSSERVMQRKETKEKWDELVKEEKECLAKIQTQLIAKKWTEKSGKESKDQPDFTAFENLVEKERRVDEQLVHFGRFTVNAAMLGAGLIFGAKYLLKDVNNNYGWLSKLKLFLGYSSALIAVCSGLRAWVFNANRRKRREQIKNDLFVNEKKEKPDTTYLAQYNKAYNNINEFVLKDACGKAKSYDGTVIPDPRFILGDDAGAFYGIFGFTPENGHKTELNQITKAKPFLRLMFGDSDYSDHDNINLLLKLKQRQYCEDNEAKWELSEEGRSDEGKEFYGDYTETSKAYYNKNGYLPEIVPGTDGKEIEIHYNK